MSTTIGNTIVWKEPPLVMGVMVTAVFMAIILFQDGLVRMVQAWQGQEEYSYGYLIPFISIFLIWQKKDILHTIPFSGSWAGVGLTLLGMGLFALGQLGSAYSIIQYSFVVVIFGLALSFLGWRAFKVIFVPLAFLFFMVPLPGFINQSLSNTLQLISSELGVAVVRLCGISVYLEGNVVDLGSYKLEVAEACSGLRYLYPLMVFGLIAAYFFKVSFWKKALLFLSTIPITIAMNSIRIGLIGVTVEYWGPSMAEGVLHDFEGWVMFMVCIGVLAIEMWLMARISADPRPLRQVFGLTFPSHQEPDSQIRCRSIPRQFYMAVTLVLAMIAISYLSPERKEIIPNRQGLTLFPLVIDDWRGDLQHLDEVYIDALNFDDYLMANYSNRDNDTINLYIGYYATQHADKVPHSPRACLPGGGWKISEIGEYSVPEVLSSGKSIKVNRAMIEKGDEKLLVYYWFQQRGRIIANEFAVKGYLFWDSMKRQRSDGALVRLMTTLRPGEEIAKADSELSHFSESLLPLLPRYVPN